MSSDTARLPSFRGSLLHKPIGLLQLGRWTCKPIGGPSFLYCFFPPSKIKPMIHKQLFMYPKLYSNAISSVSNQTVLSCIVWKWSLGSSSMGKTYPLLKYQKLRLPSRYLDNIQEYLYPENPWWKTLPQFHILEKVIVLILKGGLSSSSPIVTAWSPAKVSTLSRLDCWLKLISGRLKSIHTRQAMTLSGTGR